MCVDVEAAMECRKCHPKSQRNMVICRFQNDNIIGVEITKRSYWVPARIGTSGNSIYYTAVGYENALDRITIVPGKMKSQKQERFLQMAQLAASEIKGEMGEICQQFANLIVLIQNQESKQYQKFLQMYKENDPLCVLFEHPALNKPLFTIPILDDDANEFAALKDKNRYTPDVQWWLDTYVREYHKYLAESGPILRGTCAITGDTDLIPRVHRQLPKSSVNGMGKGATLCGRNKDSMKDADYVQSESSRIGLRAMNRTMITLNHLIQNDFGEIKTNHPEKHYRRGKKLDRNVSKVIHHLVWTTEGIKKEITVFDVFNGVFDPPDESRFASQYVVDCYKGMFSGNKDAAILQSGFMYYLRVGEMKGRARFEDFRYIPLEQVFHNLKFWFEDLAICHPWPITAVNGAITQPIIEDHFGLYDKKNGERLRYKGLIDSIDATSGAVQFSDFITSALYRRNLPLSCIARTIRRTINSLLKDGFDWVNLLPRLAIIKLWLIRQHRKITPECVMENATQEYYYGMLVGTFYEHYRRYAKGTTKVKTSDFFTKHLLNIINNGISALPELMNEYFIYARHADPKSQWWWRKQICCIMQHIDMNTIRRPITPHQQAEFLMGLHAVVGKRGEVNLQSAPANLDLLGQLFSVYYRAYLVFAREQNNSDNFVLNHWKMFVTNPRCGIRRLDAQFPIHIAKTKSPAFWTKMVDSLKDQVGEFPEFLTMEQKARVVHGFFGGLVCN